jgi:hypothetical protein
MLGLERTAHTVHCAFKTRHYADMSADIHKIHSITAAVDTTTTTLLMQWLHPERQREVTGDAQTVKKLLDVL